MIYVYIYIYKYIYAYTYIAILQLLKAAMIHKMKFCIGTYNT